MMNLGPRFNVLTGEMMIYIVLWKCESFGKNNKSSSFKYVHVCPLDFPLIRMWFQIEGKKILWGKISFPSVLVCSQPRNWSTCQRIFINMFMMSLEVNKPNHLVCLSLPPLLNICIRGWGLSATSYPHP